MSIEVWPFLVSRNRYIDYRTMDESGNYDPSALAKRVNSAIQEELVLTTSDNVSVAQNGSTVELTGTISNPILLEEMQQIAIREGATQVDTTKVEVE